MLGLSTSFPYQDSPTTNPTDVSADNEILVGWWDFTDIDQLYQTKESYNTAISSDGDLIGRVKNKAYSNPNLSNPLYASGIFMRADQDGDRPTYKTGGANGHSYALFDGSNTGLACRSSSTDWGAHSTDVLSTLDWFNIALDIFIVGEPTDNDTDGVSEVAFSYYGYRGEDTSYADEEQVTLFELSREDDEDISALWTISSSGTVGDPPVPSNSLVATSPSNHWNSGEVTVINVAARSGIGNSYIYTNNTPDVGGTVFDTNAEINAELRQEGYITLNNSVWDNTKTTTIAIGGMATSTGTISSSRLFEGKIYEVLVYSLGTLDDSQRNSLFSYFATKYSI